MPAKEREHDCSELCRCGCTTSALYCAQEQRGGSQQLYSPLLGAREDQESTFHDLPPPQAAIYIAAAAMTGASASARQLARCPSVPSASASAA